MSNKDINKKEPTLQDLVLFSKKLNAWGIFLIVIGTIGLFVCLGLIIYFGVMQTIGLRHHKALPFLLLIFGIACFGCVLSAGVYMIKTSKTINSRLIKK